MYSVVFIVRERESREERNPSLEERVWKSSFSQPYQLDPSIFVVRMEIEIESKRVVKEGRALEICKHLLQLGMTGVHQDENGWMV